MTLATLMPYLLVAAGYVARHYDLLGKLFPSLASNPAPSPSTPHVLPLPTVKLGNHPVLSDAVNAAIQQGISDALSGSITSLKAELESIVKAAVAAAVADLKPKS